MYLHLVSLLYSTAIPISLLMQLSPPSNYAYIHTHMHIWLHARCRYYSTHVTAFKTVGLVCDISERHFLWIIAGSSEKLGQHIHTHMYVHYYHEHIQCDTDVNFKLDHRTCTHSPTISTRTVKLWRRTEKDCLHVMYMTIISICRYTYVN